MPQTTRSTPRSTPRQAARFGRGAANTQSGRFSRQTSGPARPRRTPTRSTARTTSPRFGRKPKQQKGIAGKLGGMLPTGAASKVTPSSKTGKAGGIAALAGAAGVAFRNRDKLTAMLGRKGGGETSETAPAPAPAPTPAPAPRTPAPGTDAQHNQPPL